MKKAFRVLLLFALGFFIVKKLYRSPETNSLKKIYETHQKGEFERASEMLDQHVKKYSKSSYGWSFLGTVSMQLYDYEKAEKSFKKAFELDDKNDKAIVGLGVMARNNGNHKLAKEMYYKAIKINPRNPDAYSSLLMLELFNKNYTEAVKLGEKAKKLNLIENKPGILANLTVAYHLNNQLEKRDIELAKLEKTNYRELGYIKMVINGEIIIDELFK